MTYFFFVCFDSKVNLLVQEAVTQDSIRKQGEDLLHYGKIVAGHDNATAAVYDNMEIIYSCGSPTSSIPIQRRIIFPFFANRISSIVAGHDNATAAVYDNSGHRRK